MRAPSEEMPMSRFPVRTVLAALLLACAAPLLADEPAAPVVKRESTATAPRSATETAVRKKSVPQVRSRVAATACTEEQETAIETARRAAAIRTQVAVDRIRGLHPSTGASDRRDAESKASELIDSDVDFGQVQEIAEGIRNRVSSAELAVVCESASNPSCTVRTAFVEDSKAPIHICPHYFETSTAEQRIRTMVHESAHLGGIREAGESESYCVLFDCSSNCGGFYAADSWAHYLHCVAGETPDDASL
jgi:hypothetical protein